MPRGWWTSQQEKDVHPGPIRDRCCSASWGPTRPQCPLKMSGTLRLFKIKYLLCRQHLRGKEHVLRLETTGAGSGISASLLRGQRHLTFEMRFAMPASGVGVRMKGSMNMKALELWPGPVVRGAPVPVTTVWSSHPQAGLVGTSRLLPSGNGQYVAGGLLRSQEASPTCSL